AVEERQHEGAETERIGERGALPAHAASSMRRESTVSRSGRPDVYSCSVSRRVLIVDDDAEIATMLSRALLRRGFSIERIADATAAVARAGEASFDAALLDLVMPGQDGMALARSLRAKLPELRIAILTGYKHSPLIDAAAKERIQVFMKPVVIQEVVAFLE